MPVCKVVSVKYMYISITSKAFIYTFHFWFILTYDAVTFQNKLEAFSIVKLDIPCLSCC